MAKWNLPSTHRGHTMKPPSPPTPSGSVCFFQRPNQPYHPCLQLATCIAGPGRRRVRCARQGGVGRFFPRRRRWRERMLVSTSNNPPRRSLLSLPYPQPPATTSNAVPQPFLYQPYPQPTIKPSLTTSTSNDQAHHLSSLPFPRPPPLPTTHDKIPASYMRGEGAEASYICEKGGGGGAGASYMGWG